MIWAHFDSSKGLTPWPFVGRRPPVIADNLCYRTWDCTSTYTLSRITSAPALLGDVMATSSIYHKACPSCATLVEVDVTQCSCGYSFETQSHESELLAIEQAAQEEQLLKEYLHARIGKRWRNCKPFKPRWYMTKK